MRKNEDFSDFGLKITLEAHTGGRLQEIQILHISMCIFDIGIEKKMLKIEKYNVSAMLHMMMKNMKISDFGFQVTLEAHTGGRF